MPKDLTPEEKSAYLHRYAENYLNQGLSFNEFYKRTQGGNLESSERYTRSIWNDEKEKYQFQQDLSKSRSQKIPYDKLPESKGRLLRNYSFVVQRGYQVDDDGNYILDKNGEKIEDYVTVISDKEMSRKEILDTARSIPSGKEGTKGYGWKGRVRLTRAVRRKR